MDCDYNPLKNLDLIRELIGAACDLMDKNFEDVIWIFSNLFKKVFLRHVVTEFISSSMASFSISKVCSGVPTEDYHLSALISTFGHLYLRITHFLLPWPS